MKIYFDESRNTGEIGFSGNQLNYFNQRYFILVGVIDENNIISDYENFVNENYERVKTKGKKSTEIKGNDLLRRDNNAILDDFIDKFVDNGNYRITIYDKKYFLVSQMILWLCGEEFRSLFYAQFLNYCDTLIKLNDELLVDYIKVTKVNDNKSIEEFIRLLLRYAYTECIGAPFEKKVILDWKKMISSLFQKEEEYFELLKYYNSENLRVKGKDRNNIVNLTALGETILSLKSDNDNLLNKDITIVHDQVNVVEDYIKHYWTEGNIIFVDSLESYGIQLADNVSSIIGHLVSKIIPLKNDSDLEKKIHPNNTWVREKFNRIIRNNFEQIKIITTMREQAFIKTFVECNETELVQFKLKMISNLNERFEIEMRNKMSLYDAFNLFNN